MLGGGIVSVGSADHGTVESVDFGTVTATVTDIHDHKVDKTVGAQTSSFSLSSCHQTSVLLWPLGRALNACPVLPGLPAHPFRSKTPLIQPFRSRHGALSATCSYSAKEHPLDALHAFPTHRARPALSADAAAAVPSALPCGVGPHDGRTPVAHGDVAARQ